MFDPIDIDPDYADPTHRPARSIPSVPDMTIAMRDGDLVEHLREQCTHPPVSPIGLRLLLDWAADEIEALREQVQS